MVAVGNYYPPMERGLKMALSESLYLDVVQVNVYK